MFASLINLLLKIATIICCSALVRYNRQFSTVIQKHDIAIFSYIGAKRCKYGRPADQIPISLTLPLYKHIH